MAKIAVEFDTVTKQATATVDGQAVDNFASLDIYQRYYDGDDEDDVPRTFSCSLRSSAEDDDHKLTRMSVVYASENSDVQVAMKNFFTKPAVVR